MAEGGGPEQVGSLLTEAEVGAHLRGRKLKILWPATGLWYEADVHRAKADGGATVWYGSEGDSEYGEAEDIDLLETVRWGHVCWCPGESLNHGERITLNETQGTGEAEVDAAEAFFGGLVGATGKPAATAATSTHGAATGASAKAAASLPKTNTSDDPLLAAGVADDDALGADTGEDDEDYIVAAKRGKKRSAPSSKNRKKASALAADAHVRLHAQSKRKRARDGMPYAAAADDQPDAAEAPDDEEDAEWDPNADRPDDEVWEPALPPTTEEEHRSVSAGDAKQSDRAASNAPQQRKRKRGAGSSAAGGGNSKRGGQHHGNAAVAAQSLAEQQYEPEKSIPSLMREDDEARGKVRERLVTALRTGEDERAVEEQRPADYANADAIADEVEKALFTTWKAEGRSAYSRAARRILYNLDDKQNPHLRAKVLFREYQAAELPHMSSDQLARPGQVSERQKVRERAEKQAFIPADSDVRADQQAVRRMASIGQEEDGQGAADGRASLLDASVYAANGNEHAPNEETKELYEIKSEGNDEVPKDARAQISNEDSSFKAEYEETRTPLESRDDHKVKVGSLETTESVKEGEEGSTPAPVMHTFKRHGQTSARSAFHNGDKKNELFELTVKLDGVYDTRLKIEPEKGTVVSAGCAEILGIRSGEVLTVKGRTKLRDVTKFAQNVRTSSKSRELSIARVYCVKESQSDNEDYEELLTHLQSRERAAYLVAKETKVEMYLIPPGEAANEISPGSADEPTSRLLGVLVHQATKRPHHAHYHHSKRHHHSAHQQHKRRHHRSEHSSKGRHSADSDHKHNKADIATESTREGDESAHRQAEGISSTSAQQHDEQTEATEAPLHQESQGPPGFKRTQATDAQAQHISLPEGVPSTNQVQNQAQSAPSQSRPPGFEDFA